MSKKTSGGSCKDLDIPMFDEDNDGCIQIAVSIWLFQWDESVKFHT